MSAFCLDTCIDASRHFAVVGLRSVLTATEAPTHPHTTKCTGSPANAGWAVSRPRFLNCVGGGARARQASLPAYRAGTSDYWREVLGVTGRRASRRCRGTRVPSV